jgi:hypothetical protein
MEPSRDSTSGRPSFKRNRAASRLATFRACMRILSGHGGSR